MRKVAVMKWAQPEVDRYDYRIFDASYLIVAAVAANWLRSKEL